MASVREIVASARPWFQAAINKRRDLYLHWEDVVPALEAFGAAEAAEAAAACDGLPHLRLLAADSLEAPTPLTPGSAVRVKTVAPPRAVHTLRVRALLEGTDGHAVPLRARTRWSDASAEIETPPLAAPPAPTARLRSAAGGVGSVEVRWQPISGAVAGAISEWVVESEYSLKASHIYKPYAVRRAVVGADGGAAGERLHNGEVLSGLSVRYRVRASEMDGEVHARGEWSGWSGRVAVPVLPPPTQLKTTIRGEQIELRWSPPVAVGCVIDGYEARLRGSIDFASKVKFSTEEVESLPNGLQQYPRYGADGVRGTGTFVYELRARARADEGAAIYSEWSAPSADSTSMEIVDAPTVRLLPRIADGAAAVEVTWVPPGGKPDADDADALHWRYQLDCMMEAVDTAGATPGGRAASWFPVAWTASEAHAVPVRLTADYGRTVRFRVRVLPGGHYGDNTWEERGVLTGYDDDGGSPGGDALGKPRRQLDLDEIRAESRRLVAGLKSVYDGKSAETFSPPSRTLALPVLIEPELLSAGRAGRG